MAMDCIACAVMPTAAWLTPVCGAEQDHTLLCGERQRRLCHSYPRQLFANAAIAASRVGVPAMRGVAAVAASVASGAVASVVLAAAWNG
jgi:hypothetical protein